MYIYIYVHTINDIRAWTPNSLPMATGRWILWCYWLPLIAGNARNHAYLSQARLVQATQADPDTQQSWKSGISNLGCASLCYLGYV